MNDINYVCSPSQNLSYPITLKNDYELTGSWPCDGIDITDEIRNQFFDNPPPKGKIRAADKDGLPVWVNIPLLGKEELVIIAQNEKNNLINEANSFINTKQWPSKLALGRLSDADKIEFNRYLDYIDALEAIDTSTAPDITFPVL